MRLEGSLVQRSRLEKAPKSSFSQAFPMHRSNINYCRARWVVTSHLPSYITSDEHQNSHQLTYPQIFPTVVPTQPRCSLFLSVFSLPSSWRPSACVPRTPVSLTAYRSPSPPVLALCRTCFSRLNTPLVRHLWTSFPDLVFSYLAPTLPAFAPTRTSRARPTPVSRRNARLRSCSPP